MKRGFTIPELLVYVSVLAIILIAVGSFLLWAIRLQTKTEVVGETTDSASRALNRITREIREAEGVYTPTSIFGAHPGQISLETAKYAPAGETSGYIDFFVCGTQLCIKQEDEDPVALTGENVEVYDFQVTQLGNSLQIELGMRYQGPPGRSEYEASIELTSTASVRQ